MIIISLGQILLSYIANTSRTHACTCTHACMCTHVHACACMHTHAHTHTHPWRSGYRCSMSTPNRNGPFRWRQWPSLLHSNKHTRGRPGLPHVLFFAYKTIARPSWDANSWEDVLSADMNSLRHFPRRSSKNCDLQFANSDRFKENYSIDIKSKYRTMYVSLKVQWNLSNTVTHGTDQKWP